MSARKRERSLANLERALTRLAEKVSALRAEAVLEERARRADRARFNDVMSRAGGTPPREGDEVTER